MNFIGNALCEDERLHDLTLHFPGSGTKQAAVLNGAGCQIDLSGMLEDEGTVTVRLLGHPVPSTGG